MLISTRSEVEDLEKKSGNLEQLLVKKDMEIISLQINGKQYKLENRNLKLFCEFQKKKFADRRN